MYKRENRSTLLTYPQTWWRVTYNSSHIHFVEEVQSWEAAQGTWTQDYSKGFLFVLRAEVCDSALKIRQQKNYSFYLVGKLILFVWLPL